uniref:Uncharacterized protein n=1 Tax=Spermophilus dauricus TaxID=99837 RepID=A0A8C9PKF1_SPEDA
MYIKPALPCLPFFVVSSINLLSRPEWGWQGSATVTGVAEANCYIFRTEKLFILKKKANQKKKLDSHAN